MHRRSFLSLLAIPQTIFDRIERDRAIRDAERRRLDAAARRDAEYLQDQLIKRANEFAAAWAGVNLEALAIAWSTIAERQRETGTIDVNAAMEVNRQMKHVQKTVEVWRQLLKSEGWARE